MSAVTPCPLCGTPGAADAARCPGCQRNDPYLGEVLLGKYRCVERVGGDAASSHYRAIHVKLDQPRSIHVLRADLRDKPEAVDAFYTEGRLLAALRTDGAALLHDVDTLADATPCSIWDLQTGTPLVDRVTEAPLGAQAASVTRGLCAVLAALHQRGLAHLDLCPENVLLIEGTAPPVPLLIGYFETRSFGSPAGRSITDPRIGFAAPEQVLEGGTVDARADVFAIGALIAYLLTGQRILATPDLDAYAFELRRLEPARLKVIALLPAGLRTIVARCIARDPADRPADANEVQDAIRRVARAGARSTAGEVTTESPHEDAAIKATLRIDGSGAPRPDPAPVNAWLEPVTGDAGGPMRLPNDAIIGRASECGLMLEHPTVSKRHAHIRNVGGTYMITDLGSRNGSSVNGRRVRDATSLTSGDTVVLGDVVFRFRIEGADKELPAMHGETTAG